MKICTYRCAIKSSICIRHGCFWEKNGSCLSNEILEDRGGFFRGMYKRGSLLKRHWLARRSGAALCPVLVAINCAEIVTNRTDLYKANDLVPNRFLDVRIARQWTATWIWAHKLLCFRWKKCIVLFVEAKDEKYRQDQWARQIGSWAYAKHAVRRKTEFWRYRERNDSIGKGDRCDLTGSVCRSSDRDKRKSRTLT